MGTKREEKVYKQTAWFSGIACASAGSCCWSWSLGQTNMQWGGRLEGNDLCNPQEMWAGVRKAGSWCFVAVPGRRLWGCVWRRRNRGRRRGREREGEGEGLP